MKLRDNLRQAIERFKELEARNNQLLANIERNRLASEEQLREMNKEAAQAMLVQIQARNDLEQDIEVKIAEIQRLENTITQVSDQHSRDAQRTQGQINQLTQDVDLLKRNLRNEKNISQIYHDAFLRERESREAALRALEEERMRQVQEFTSLSYDFDQVVKSIENILREGVASGQAAWQAFQVELDKVADEIGQMAEDGKQAVQKTMDQIEDGMREGAQTMQKTWKKTKKQIQDFWKSLFQKDDQQKK